MTKPRGKTVSALRKAGYVPLPRMWVLPDELDVIMKIARKHESEIVRIRDEARDNKGHFK